MRTAFIETLCDLALYDESIWLLCGDLGYSVLEIFSHQFPDRFVNVGIAEQNMAGIAAGLALSNKTVFIYSIANFPTIRCMEQIRNDICYHNANVKIVSVGSGYTYGSQGYTHHGLEDMAMMRVLPNMTVISPGDPVESRLATRAITSHRGPCYLRLGKAGEPIVYSSDPKFYLGKAIVVHDGKDLTLIVTGGILKLAADLVNILNTEGISVKLISMPTVSPLDEEIIQKSVFETRKILTLEEHGIGGLGSCVAEVLAPMNESCIFVPLYLPRHPFQYAGSKVYCMERQGLSTQFILDSIRKVAKS